ncbi:MAG TPA: phosphate ABC transporter substrate-binding protein PstS [Rhizobiaceae bacterium]|nr:phosphate ABC transporter substrate-binding protein PstS [Rhizobiaceae bacterium]
MLSGWRKLAQPAVAALAVAALLATPVPALADRVQGAGSTFAFPIIRAWTISFLKYRNDGSDFVVDDIGVDYEPVGSIGGIMRLAQPEMDFAASDAPLPPDELQKRGLAQFPFVIGGLVPIVNLEGIKSGELKLSGDLIAKMYLGQIAKWNDPAIVAVNPSLTLPDQAIKVVHRSDGSGSTLTWTRYLSLSNAEWKDGPGADTIIDWPGGTAAEGTSGILRAVRGTRGSIGYIEYGQAVRENMIFAQVSNKPGTFVMPSPEAFAETANSANWDPANGFYLQLTDVDAPNAYPLAAATFALMHKTERSSSRTRRTLFFFSHALKRGGDDAALLGYVPLPAPLVEKVKTYWHEVLPGAAGL